MLSNVIDFQGFTGTNIHYNEATNEWEMTNGPDSGEIQLNDLFQVQNLSDINGTSPSSIQSMGTGTMKWNVNKVVSIISIISFNNLSVQDICNRNTLEAFDTVMTVCNVG